MDLSFKESAMDRDDLREQMMELVENFESSGLDRASYSRLHGVSLSKFDYWRSKWKREQGSDVQEAEFVELDLGRSSSVRASTPDLEVELPHGIKLRFYNVGSHR
jgi:transposase-like protein